VARTLHSSKQLQALCDLIVAALADCDAPGATEADRGEWDRLIAYRGAVLDAARGRELVYADPDAQAMADYLTGEGPYPLTPLGHSHEWQTEPPRPAAARGSWVDEVVAFAQPVAARPAAGAGAVPPPRPRLVPAPRPHPVPAAPPAASEHAHRQAVYSGISLVLAGEDRTAGNGRGLYVDLIPVSSWYNNVRSAVSQEDWRRISQMVRYRAGWRCEVCDLGLSRDRDLLDAHERWNFDPHTRVQRLVRLISLCAVCHTATHFGFASLTGEAEAALRHLQRVNDWTPHQARRHVETARARARRLSRTTWTLDLSVIAAAGVRPLPGRRAGPGSEALL
jgi:hypothetical protein